nr:retrovirus-related Pol polyprotein from transposon TNT 1-94 [Tanacetum cinerariifolium]
MSRDVITVGSTIRIPLLYRGEYSQWCERFMNYLEEQTDGEAMINSIQNGNQPLPVIAQVSLAGTAQNAPPTLKDLKFWTTKEKKTRKIDRLARSLFIQGLPNDIYSLIDSNKTAKDLWDALERQMRGSEYGEQDRKATILYEYETFKAIEGDQLLDTYLSYLQVINDLKKCGYKKDNCKLNYKLLNNLQQEWKQYATLMRQTKNLMDINIDALYNILMQNQGDVNDALGYKIKSVMVHSDTLALVAKKTNMSKQKEKVVVSSDSKESGTDDFSELKKITALLAKAFNRSKFYSKPTNNNLRTSSTSQSANKKQEFVKSDDKKEDNKANEKKRDMSKVKCYNCKKEGHFDKDCMKAKVKDYNYYKTKMLLAKKDNDEQVLLAEDQAWMESVVILIKKSMQTWFSWLKLKSEYEFETSEYYDNSTNYDLFVNNDDDQEIFYNAIESASENFIENHIDSQKDYDKSEVYHNDSEEKEHLVDKLIRKFNRKIAKCQKRIEKTNQQSKDFENQNKDLQEKYDVLINQVNTFEEKNNEFNDQIKVLNEKNVDLLAQTKVLKDQLQVKHVVIDTHIECHDKYAKLEEERYEYMIKYYALFDNDKQHRKQIADQEVLFDKMSVELVELDKHVRDLKNTILEKDFKIFELEECVRNKDFEIEKCLERLNDCENKLHKIGQTNQTVHMIMPSKDKLYNGRKGIGFENSSYFEKAKDLRPALYDEKVIGLGYTLMFLTHPNEALEIEKFKRSKENKIEFAYDYGNLNASYQTSSLKPYVSNVILEKIIIDLEDEVVSLLEKEKENLKTIESLKSNGFKSSENAFFELENQGENDYLEVEKECDKVENPKVIAPRLFKLNLDTFSSVRIPKHSSVIWKKKGSSNTSNVDLSAIVQICLWIIDSGCSKHMKGNRALLTNFVEKFLGTVRFGSNDFAVIVGYGDVVIGSMTINKVYYVEGLGHNLFSVGQFCDKGLKVSFRKSTCFVRNEDAVDLLTVQRVQTNNGTEFKNITLAKFFDKVGITQQFSAARTPQQNGVVERRNRTLVEATRTMLTFANLPSFLWAEAITTACFTQNRSIIHKRFDKTPYELMNKRKPNIKFFRVFGCRCYLLNDYEDVGKLDIGVFVGYSKDLEPGLSNLNEMGKSLNPLVSQVSETSKKDLEDLFHNFYDEYFDSSKIMKSSTTNVKTLINEDVFHEVSESIQGESFSSSLNDDVQQNPEEVILPQTNTQSILNNMIPIGDEASTSHNVFNECLEDAYFDASTSFHDPSNVHTYYQPYPHEKK